MSLGKSLALFVLLVITSDALAQGTAFTYQGRLFDNAAAANGTYDFRFTLHDALSSGSQIAGPIAVAPVTVSNGVFVVTLDFGAGAFNGNPRWLQLGVRTNGSVVAHVALSPRHPVTATPYAILAGNLSGSVADSQLSANIARLNANQTFVGQLSLVPPVGSPVGGVGGFPEVAARIRNGAAGSHSALSIDAASNQDPILYFAENGSAWWGLRMDADAGKLMQLRYHGGGANATILSVTTNGAVGIGTTQPGERLELFGPDTTLRIRNVNDGAGAFLGNTYGTLQLGLYNASTSSVYQGLAPGEKRSFFGLSVGGVVGSMTNDYYSPVFRNLLDNGAGSFVVDNLDANAGGLRPGILFGSGFTGEGMSSQRGTNGQNRWGLDFYTGFQNRLAIANGGNVGIGTTTPQAKLDVAGTIRGTGLQLTGGASDGALLQSDASGNASWSSGLRLQNVSSGGGISAIYSQNLIVGLQNVVSNGVLGGTIGGGGNYAANLINPSYPNVVGGNYATVPGGAGNVAAGAFSFAAGRRARANHSGAFVLTDSQNSDFSSSGNNQFLIRAQGGVGINTTAPAGTIDVNGSAFVRGGLVVTGGGADIDTGAGLVQVRNDAGFTPALNLSGGPNPGILRVRNAIEVWPNDAGTQPGKVDVRNTSGATTISLDGGSGEATVKVLNITGGADIAEPFRMSHAHELPKGAVVVIDEENPGQLKLSEHAYDTRVAGIVSGANGVNPGLALHQQGVVEGGQNVALTGRVYALADAGEAPIKPGDLLTTSPTPGHVMKAVDRERGAGAILGKAMTGLPAGKGTVLVLVSLQ